MTDVISVPVSTLNPADRCWPAGLAARLGRKTPARLWMVGNAELLPARKIALFCSVGCPGQAISVAASAARKLRDCDLPVISGFQSPVEREILRILLRERRAIVVCLAHSLQRFRLPEDWRENLRSDRLLLLSRFEKTRRADKETARRRNELVAALAEKALIVYAAPGGQIENLSRRFDEWGIEHARLPHPIVSG